MVYTELQSLCEKRNLQIKEVCLAIGMTYTGLRDALNRKTLPIKKILPLCELLKISPNELLDWKEYIPTYNATQYGMLNNQNIGGIELLQKQLEVKDEQISQLLNLLNK